MTMQIRPIADHCGAEASGIDLRALDDSGIDALKAAVAERGVLFVRDQELTPEDHIAFGDVA